MAEGRDPFASSGMAIFGITSASGGLGVSTLTCALGAAVVRQGGTAVVVDGTVMHGGLHVTAGVEHEPGYRWRDLVEVDGPVDGERLLGHLPVAAGVAVLSAGRATGAPDGVLDEDVPPAAFTGVVRSLGRVCDLVVIDWGRSWPLAGVGEAWLIVAGLSPSGLADVAAAVRHREVAGCAGVVTRGRRPDSGLAAALAGHVGLPLLGELADDRTVARAVERGDLPGERSRGPLARVADALATALVEAV